MSERELLPVDITDFCWTIYQADGGADRLCLCLFCAPGKGPELAAALKDCGAAPRSKSSVIFRKPRDVQNMMRRLSQDAVLHSWLDRYRRSWVGGRRGLRVSPPLQLEREETVDAILRHLRLDLPPMTGGRTQ